MSLYRYRIVEDKSGQQTKWILECRLWPFKWKKFVLNDIKAEILFWSVFSSLGEALEWCPVIGPKIVINNDYGFSEA